jgi:hypothetical protein
MEHELDISTGPSVRAAEQPGEPLIRGLPTPTITEVVPMYKSEPLPGCRLQNLFVQLVCQVPGFVLDAALGVVV